MLPTVALPKAIVAADGLGNVGGDPLGIGCPASGGEIPRVVIEAPCNLAAGATVTLLLDQTDPLELVLLLFGSQPASIPIGSCTLRVAPVIGPIIPFVTDRSGAAALSGIVPHGLSGLSLHMQAFIADHVAPNGDSASNGLTLHLP